MSHLHQPVRTYLLDGGVVDVMGLLEHIVIGHHCGIQLLVAILCKLLLEACQRIVAGIKGCSHLQLIVEEEVNILIDGFLIDDALGVVLVIAVVELRLQDILPIDGHHHGVGLRRYAASE